MTIDKLINVLRFYANKTSYKATRHSFGDVYVDEYPILVDNGDKAKEAIIEYEASKDDGISIVAIISFCLFAGFLFGRWWEHRLYLDFMFDRISQMIGG